MNYKLALKVVKSESDEQTAYRISELYKTIAELCKSPNGVGIKCPQCVEKTLSKHMLKDYKKRFNNLSYERNSKNKNNKG